MLGRFVQAPCESRDVHPAGEPLRDLLQEPNVAVGIAERGIGGVGTVLRIRSGGTRLGARDEAAAEATAAS